MEFVVESIDAGLLFVAVEKVIVTAVASLFVVAAVERSIALAVVVVLNVAAEPVIVVAE